MVDFGALGQPVKCYEGIAKFSQGGVDILSMINNVIN